MHPEGFAPGLDEVLRRSMAGPAGEPESSAGGPRVTAGGGSEGDGDEVKQSDKMNFLPAGPALLSLN